MIIVFVMYIYTKIYGSKYSDVIQIIFKLIEQLLPGPFWPKLLDR